MIKTGDPVVLKFNPRTREIKRYDGKVYAYESMENAQKYLKPGEKDAILMEYVPKPEWIPMEERLPENGQKVIRYHGYAWDEKITLAFYCEGDEKRYAWCDVTHWMPMPEAPKEE